MPSTTPWRLGYRPSLDALRGIAVLLVLVGHTDLGFVWGLPATIGLAIFFSLSGFLITALLLDEREKAGRIDLHGFYVRRVQRLLPALAVFAPLMVLLGLASIPALLSVAFYVSNWAALAGVTLGALGHLWSLSVEEQFYLVWPVVLILAGRRALPVVLVGIGVSLLAVAAADGNLLRIAVGSDTRAMSLLSGALLAIVSKRIGRVPNSAILSLAGVASLTLCGILAIPFAVVIEAVAATAVIAWMAANPTMFAPRWLTATGRISYGMYLWHYPIAMTLWVSPLPWVIRVGILLGATYLLAGLSWVLIERRFIRRGSGPIAISVPRVPIAALAPA